jgi:hypothetical protein
MQPVQLYYLGFKALQILEDRLKLDENHEHYISLEALESLALQESIYKSIDYITNLYRLLDGDSGALHSYLLDLFGKSVHYNDDTGYYEATMFKIDAETHLLWSAFVYDYFGRERDYTDIPLLSDEKLLNARFALKVNDNAIYRDRPMFNELILGKQQDLFTLSDILIGTDQQARFHQDVKKHSADNLRYMLQEAEIRFVDKDTIDVFYNIWKEIMRRDTSGLSELFSDDMLKMLASSYIPLFTVYDPGNRDKWEFRGADEINLAYYWQFATLAMIHVKPVDFMHYKISEKTAESVFYESMFDLLNWFTSSYSRVLQFTWIKVKDAARWVYHMMEKY